MNTLKVEIVVPDWVNWIAVDKDGRVDGYENKPIKGGEYWFSDNIRGREIYQGKPPKNWKDELYTWG